MRIKRLVTILVSVISIVNCVVVPASSLPQTKKVQIRVRVAGSKYCLFGGAGLTKLQLNLSLDFQNLTGAPVKVNRVAISGAVFVGKSEQDIAAEKYEPGSRMPESLGTQDKADWQDVERTVLPGQSIHITNVDIWMRVASGTEKNQAALGLSSGRHFLQIPVALEASDSSHDSLTMTLSSVPAPFRVEVEQEIEGCP
jgi:hypothetical protein